jgi:hypothetical protein
MNNTVSGAAMVAQWRNSAELDNPAGPLFTGGEFAPTDIVWDCTGGGPTGCSQCSGSSPHQCC